MGLNSPERGKTSRGGEGGEGPILGTYGVG